MRQPSRVARTNARTRSGFSFQRAARVITTTTYGLNPSVATRNAAGSPLALGRDRLGRDEALLGEVLVGDEAGDAAVVRHDLHLVEPVLLLEVGGVRRPRLDRERARLEDVGDALRAAALVGHDGLRRGLEHGEEGSTSAPRARAVSTSSAPEMPKSTCPPATIWTTGTPAPPPRISTSSPSLANAPDSARRRTRRTRAPGPS